MPGITLPKPFEGNQHESFRWEGNDCAALLVHGFPGTPAEMRPLGTVLMEAGWTVHGLMLPGLGADITNLDKRSCQDWSNAVRQAVDELRRTNSVIIVVGYSMGGALALHSANELQPAGLVLLAPFWSFDLVWLNALWPIVKLLCRRVHFFKYTDFSAPDFRRGLQRMFHNIDLDDAATRQALRDMALSFQPLDQVRQLGRSAFARAADIDIPTLVIQGNRDKVVPPQRTMRLINRFPTQVEYLNVAAAHDLVDPACDGWTEVTAGLIRFAESIRRRSTKS